MRLFTALWPSQEAVRHLAAAVETVRSTQPKRLAQATEGLRKFRFLPPERWHLTLCFHGDDAEPDRVGDRLARRVGRVGRTQPGFGPPRLRMTGAGVFRGVLWVGVQPGGQEDAAVLSTVAGMAGADARSFRAHVTVARWAAGRADRALPDLLTAYEGPWWSADEVSVVSSEQQSSAPVYRTIRRVALTAVD
ncbi:RNA 2',3'-cyclic phosphodiesterase [Haloactinomyces albus]|uniref:RNA 2',3'-cyclic phosphodiesterase n=1 Tax=Haloactinomyces albus TaxID=1352928 RepID=A0AAE3Z968_9ACTN|nr:RNA 2',3'-cyclic phosphodiesterase [Haloactinomyces albus]MDR7300636.1 2'-5' RNA ligase [Haloactinomyces albus]